MRNLLFISCFLVSVSGLFGQQIVRSTVGAAGSTAVVSQENQSLIVQQSVGQASVIGSFQNTQLALRQGFIQPPVSVAGIVETETDLQASLYPNPFTSNVNVVFEEELEGPLAIRIYDMGGRLVHTKELQAERQITLDLGFLSTAQYVLLIQSETKQFKANILKN